MNLSNLFSYPYELWINLTYSDQKLISNFTHELSTGLDPTATSGNIGHIDRLGRYRSHFEQAPPDSSDRKDSTVSEMRSTAAAFVGSKLPKVILGYTALISS